MPVRTALRPGVVSPTLPVPRSIAPPEYVWKPTVKEGSEPWVQTPEVIEKTGAKLRSMMPWIQKKNIKGAQAAY